MSVYQERLSPSPWLYVALLIAIPSITVLFSAFGLLVLGIVTASIIYLSICLLFHFMSPKIIITEDWFQVGQAKIERKFLGSVESFYDEDAFEQRGRKLDLQSFYVIRAGINPVLKIEIIDPNDTVPYWLVSTRKPDRISEILSSK